MTYEYRCEPCNKTFDVTKSMKDADVNEYCPSCGEFAVRKPFPSRIYLSGTSVTHPEYNPGLGQVVKDKHHKQEICKRKGLVEIGNDFKSSDSMQKHFDDQRADKHKKSWEND